ncbi:hypothetical protein HNO52_18140 [Billgrantia diversa]|uniref:hypothetical protein n=1 Tax=Halomonas sp. MCCC 1A13316 TaxID=2733487 RepID=UPI0018A65D39|nr:hypothetical protein [Halomonas sp. MCCC 1A13316]QOR40225.1 hypothetical protein HNO52_18140 [Halomonas sp. MCCC 1A13316]
MIGNLLPSETYVVDFRDSRIGVRNASLMLGVTVTQLREAILGEKKIRGVTPPKPIYKGGQRRSEMIFKAGDVMDCAEAIKLAEADGETKL